MSDEETWANLTNGTGQPMPEVAIEKLADTARWMLWLKTWLDVGCAAYLWLATKHLRKVQP